VNKRIFKTSLVGKLIEKAGTIPVDKDGGEGISSLPKLPICSAPASRGNLP
jgi:hypothetical protein